MNGPTREVSTYYLDTTNKLYSPITWADVPQGQSGEILLQMAGLKQRGMNTSAIDCREPFTISFEYENKKLLPDSRFFIVIRNAKGDTVFTTSDYDLITDEASNRKIGKFVSEVTVPGALLKAGSYYGTIGADIKNDRVIFESGDDTLAERHNRVGLIAPLLRWQTSEPDSKPQR
jgi:hypothetical protein